LVDGKIMRLREVPESYLRWLWENVDLREPLKSGVHRALDGGGFQVAPEKLRQVYHELALKYHPGWPTRGWMVGEYQQTTKEKSRWRKRWKMGWQEGRAPHPSERTVRAKVGAIIRAQSFHD